MISLCRTENVVSKTCPNCNRRLLEPNKFCRWCGFSLSGGSGSVTEVAWHDQKTTVLKNDEEISRSLSSVAPVTPAEKTVWRAQKTTVLGNEDEISQPLSRVVIDTLKLSVAVKTGPLHLNRFGILVLAVLISIPMWLLIILLSPLEAFMAAKAISTQMSIQ